MRRLFVLLVEDSALFRSALANLFSQKSEFSLTVCSSTSFPKRLSRTACDVVVIDVVTWSSSPEALLGTVRQASMSVPTIVLGREDLLGSYLRAFRQGAVGFVKQTAPAHVLFQAVRAVARGKVWIDGKLFRQALVSYTSTRREQTTQFTPREQLIVDLVAHGKTNKEIGVCLGLTERTIKAYVSNLCRKIGVPNRSALTGYAIAHNLIPFTPTN